MAEDVAADYLGLPTDAERARLYRNRGDGTFEDVTKAAGLYRVIPAMGLNFGDLDNDGWLDFYLGTGNPDLSTLVPNRMFRNDGGPRFQDVTTAGDFGHLQKGHGVAFGDLDNDGDQDVFEEMGGAVPGRHAPTARSTRTRATTNRWLGLELEGVRSNRSAVGARIKVAIEGKGGRRDRPPLDPQRGQLRWLPLPAAHRARGRRADRPGQGDLAAHRRDAVDPRAFAWTLVPPAGRRGGSTLVGAAGEADPRREGAGRPPEPDELEPPREPDDHHVVGEGGVAVLVLTRPL